MTKLIVAFRIFVNALSKRYVVMSDYIVPLFLEVSMRGDILGFSEPLPSNDLKYAGNTFSPPSLHCALIQVIQCPI